MAQEQVALSEADVAKYQALQQEAKDKVTELKQWKEKADKPTAAFTEALSDCYDCCDAIFGILRDDPQFAGIGEELALALVDMRNHLGTDIMPLEKFSAFPRGRVGIGRKTLITSQYYEEIPYYGPPRSVKDGRKANEITKFYEWKVIACAKDHMQYGKSYGLDSTFYLERGDMGGPHYVLGMAGKGVHSNMGTFMGEAAKPSFFFLERRIAGIVLNQQRGNPTPAIASFHRAV